MSTAVEPLTAGGRREPERTGKGGAMDEYPDEAKFQALTHYVLAGRNCAEAERRIKAEHGEGPHYRTIWKWVGENPDLVERLQQELVPRVSARSAAASEAIVAQIDNLADDLLERLRSGIPDLKPREAATVLKELSIVKGINVEKSLLLRNKPTQIVEHRDVIKAMEFLERKGWQWNGESSGASREAVEGDSVSLGAAVPAREAVAAIAGHESGKDAGVSAVSPAGQS